MSDPVCSVSRGWMGGGRQGDEGDGGGRQRNEKDGVWWASDGQKKRVEVGRGREGQVG